MEENENTTNERQLKVYHKYIPRSYYGHVIFPEIDFVANGFVTLASTADNL